MLKKSSLLLVVLFNISFCNDYITDIKQAKVGECYKKIILPAKYETKEELIEIEKASKKIIVKNPRFKTISKQIEVSPSYTEIKDIMAQFKTVPKKFPINEKKVYYTIGKNKQIPLKPEFVKYVKKQGIDLDSLKVGECYIEYAKLQPPKVIKKEFIKKQAYEIIDIEPPKFKIIKKKIEIKPAYTKIVKTPAVYETKTEKILVKPAQKKYIKESNGVVCITEIPPVYKAITKKILKTPPLTKVIKFPPVYKEIKVKVFEKSAQVSRRVVPQKKSTYNFFIENQPKYFWLKEDVKTQANATGLKICKKETKQKYIEEMIQTVVQPASTKKITVPAKTISIKTKILLSDSNTTTLNLPPQYEKINSKVEVSPSRIVWKKVECEKSKDSKTDAVK